MADHVTVAGGGHEDVGLVGGIFHGHDLVAFHAGLQGVDGVDLRHPHLGAQRSQRLGAALAHVTVASDHSDLAGDHHVGGTLDAVHQRFAAAVQVVELGLGHRVVHVDGAELQCAVGRHFVQAVHTSGGFFGHAHDLGGLAAVPGGVLGQLGTDSGKHNLFFFRAGVVQHGEVFFSAHAQVHEHGGVAAVVQDHVGAFGIAACGAEFKDTVGVIPVVFQCFTLDGEHGHTGGGNRGRGVVLGREDIARSPAHFCAQCGQCLDQHGGLNRHVQGAGDACALQGLLRSKLFTHSHQAGHFGFSDLDFFTTPVGQRDVRNGAVECVAHGFSCAENNLKKPRSGDFGLTGLTAQKAWVSVVAKKRAPPEAALLPFRASRHR